MTQRIKITGYIDPNDLEPELLDLNHPTGLSEQGHEQLLSAFSDGPAYKLSDLEESEAELVDE